MPSQSRAQQRLTQAAARGARFEKAKDVRESMTPTQRQDFSIGAMANKPAHAAPRRRRLPHPHKNLGAYLHPHGGGK